MYKLVHEPNIVNLYIIFMLINMLQNLLLQVGFTMINFKPFSENSNFIYLVLNLQKGIAEGFLKINLAKSGKHTW